MGKTAQTPAFGGPGQASLGEVIRNRSNDKALGYYQNTLNNQKEAAANQAAQAAQSQDNQNAAAAYQDKLIEKLSAANRAAQSQPQDTPKPLGVDIPIAHLFQGFGNQQQGQGGNAAGFQGAYNAYMDRYGNAGGAPMQQPPAAPPGGQPQPGTPPPDQMRPQDPRQRQRPGIRMGGGYSSRT